MLNNGSSYSWGKLLEKLSRLIEAKPKNIISDTCNSFVRAGIFENTVTFKHHLIETDKKMLCLCFKCEHMNYQLHMKHIKIILKQLKKQNVVFVKKVFSNVDCIEQNHDK